MQNLNIRIYNTEEKRLYHQHSEITATHFQFISYQPFMCNYKFGIILVTHMLSCQGLLNIQTHRQPHASSGTGPLGRNNSLPTGQHHMLLFSTCPCSGPVQFRCKETADISEDTGATSLKDSSCPIGVNIWYSNSIDIASKFPRWTCQVSRVTVLGSHSMAPFQVVTVL